jgi:hypothetical protein
MLFFLEVCKNFVLSHPKMKSKISNNCLTEHRYFGMGMILNYSSAALFALLISFGQFSAFANNGAVKYTIRNHTPVFEKAHSFSDLEIPFGLPFESAPTASKFETPDDTDSDDDSDKGGNFHARTHSIEQSICPQISAVLFSTVNGFTQNRSSVPFFILYHSWKSYLS